MSFRKLAFSTLLLTSGLSAADWNVDAGGSWGTGTNWSPPIPPNNQTDTADFGTKITAPRIITLDVPPTISPTVGSLSFNNANSYTISSGSNNLTLNVGGFSSIDIILGAHTIAAPLVIKDQLSINNLSGSIFTISGSSITGTGSLTLNSGILHVNTSIAITGPITLNAGTMAISGFGITTPIALTMSPGATFDISSAGVPQTIGTLSGAGTITLGTTDLEHMGSGSIYSGSIIGTGTFIHTLGVLALDGISTAPVQVNPGAFLEGTGTVGRIVNIGIVAPGNSSIGTLTVTGNYDELGTFIAEVNDAGASSQLNVGGNFSINPFTTLILSPDPGTYPDNLTYTLATYGGVRSGTYTHTSTMLPNRFSATIVYDDAGKHILAVLAVNPFINIITGGNAGQVAKCIETIPHGTGTDGQTIINALESISNNMGELRSALNQLQPSQMGALTLAQENNDILVRSALTQRFWYRLKRQKTQEATPTIKNNCVWFEGLGKYADQDHKQQNFGYRARTGGGVLGADSRLGNHFYLGSGFAYTFTNLDWKESAGNAFINSYYATLYGLWYNKRAFIDASAIASYNHYHASRHIHFATIDRHANNQHNGYQLAGSLGFGLFFNPTVQLQPYARADYIFIHENGFKEHGADSVNTIVHQKISRFVRSDAGLRVAKDFQFENGTKVIPYAKVSWIFEDQLDGGHYRAHFKHSSCQMNLIGMHPIRNLFAPSFGVTVLGFDDALTFSLHSDTEVGSKFWETRGYVNFGYRY